MKLFFFIILLFLLNNCSFDNKTGIWEDKNISDSKKRENKIFDDFKKISSLEKVFNEKISPDGKLTLDIPEAISNKNWNDIYYAKNNNFVNFKYNSSNEIIFKSRKLSKHLIGNNKLYNEGNLIIYDIKGNLIVYSISKKKIISKFNFYKKKYKKIKKKLNFIVQDKIIYIADNLGYFYAFDYVNNSLIWAKNYKIPFNSNLKILQDKIVASNQNNNLYVLSKINGDLLKSIPTEEFNVKNKFTNNLSINSNGELFFLNSFGSLYSINLNSIKVNWFNNFNQSMNTISSNYFEGVEIINDGKIIIISNNRDTYVIDANSGSVIQKYNFSAKIKPIIIKDKIFILTKNNYLVTINLKNLKILYSFNLGETGNFNDENIKKNIFLTKMILNSEIYIFLNNSVILNFAIEGKFKGSIKIPSKIITNPILIENRILFLNKSNKLIILD